MSTPVASKDSGTVVGLNIIAGIALILCVIGFFNEAGFEPIAASFFAALGSRALAKVIEILINIDHNIANIGRRADNLDHNLVTSTNHLNDINRKTRY